MVPGVPDQPWQPSADPDGRTLPVADRLALVAAGGDVFVGHNVGGARHVFGGLLVAHALRAAHLTVTAAHRPVSLHASFVLAGKGDEPLRYEVERTRNGMSFSTRRVVCRQSRGVVLVAQADFHAEEAGEEYDLAPAPGVPGPEGLPPGRYASPWFESRDVAVGAPAAPPHCRRAWFRPWLPVPDDPDLHLHALAYLSDHGPTRAVRQPHADHPGVANRMSVSLDHAVWFHRPVDVNQWLLYELWPAATAGGRGLAIGTVRTAAGAVVATVAQEALLRLPG